MDGPQTVTWVLLAWFSVTGLDSWWCGFCWLVDRIEKKNEKEKNPVFRGVELTVIFK